MKYPTCDLDEANEKLFYLYCPSACMKIFNINAIILMRDEAV